jgi:glucose-6-phosphate dehydrogenase assembly protein OpcA
VAPAVSDQPLQHLAESEAVELPEWEAAGTSVREIEEQLGRLWEHPDDRAAGRAALPRARASILNLIVTVMDVGAAERALKTLRDLEIRHPSRAIVLIADHDAQGDPLDARISVHCHPSPSGEERVCYEEVVLTVRGDAAEHLSGIVAPLLIHDLPTHVWWPGEPPWGHPVFEQLVEIADRLIVDSSDFADLLLGYRRLANLRRHTGVGDLAWDRIGWWQELTASFFDAPRFRRYLPNLNRLWLRYAVPPPGHPPSALPQLTGDVTPTVAAPISQSILYAGWVASRLGWRRDRAQETLSDGRLRLRLEGRYEMVDLLLEPVETDRLPPGELTSVHLRALGETGAAEFIIDRIDDEAMVATNADGMTALLRRVPMEMPRESDLLSTDLVAERHDPVFEAALRAGAVFLASVQPPEPSVRAA